MLRVGWAFLAGFVVLPAVLPAQERLIAEGMPEVHLVLNGVDVVIDRDGADCPPECVQPMRAADGVATLGALEVIGLLQTEVSVGGGLLVDVRLPEEFAAGHLPGAVNVPAVTLAPGNPALNRILMALGAAETAEGLDFASAQPLTLYGVGPGEAEAVRTLVQAGFPAGKLRFFRGGMQEWLQFGLTVLRPGQEE